MTTTPTPADQPAPFRYLDEDDYCLSARLLPDLNTGRATNIVSITIEGSDEPQSVHVPVSDLPKVLGGIAGAADLAVARQILGTTVTVSCSDVRLNNGENLKALAVGDSLELSEPTAGMQPGTWQVVAYHGEFQDRATMRPVPAPAVTEEPGR
ncbi:hypothetical protein ACFU98_10755 [Streptomyces sp. NPDC057575]|uniref:hypothetical protein n=1 Tax=unclassified Streptomyces TaxID=2593676 RepID=UPI00367D9175